MIHKCMMEVVVTSLVEEVSCNGKVEEGKVMEVVVICNSMLVEEMVTEAEEIYSSKVAVGKVRVVVEICSSMEEEEMGTVVGEICSSK